MFLPFWSRIWFHNDYNGIIMNACTLFLVSHLRCISSLYFTWLNWLQLWKGSVDFNNYLNLQIIFEFKVTGHMFRIFVPPANKVWGLYRNHPVCASICLSRVNLTFATTFEPKEGLSYYTCVFLVRLFCWYQKFWYRGLDLDFWPTFEPKGLDFWPTFEPKEIEL